MFSSSENSRYSSFVAGGSLRSPFSRSLILATTKKFIPNDGTGRFAGAFNDDEISADIYASYYPSSLLLQQKKPDCSGFLCLCLHPQLSTTECAVERGGTNHCAAERSVTTTCNHVSSTQALCKGMQVCALGERVLEVITLLSVLTDDLPAVAPIGAKVRWCERKKNCLCLSLLSLI